MGARVEAVSDFSFSHFVLSVSYMQAVKHPEAGSAFAGADRYGTYLPRRRRMHAFHPALSAARVRQFSSA